MVAKLRLLFSLFTDLSDDLARPVVFPLVYLVSLVRLFTNFLFLISYFFLSTHASPLLQLTVESEAKELPAVKGATCPGTEYIHLLDYIETCIYICIYSYYSFRARFGDRGVRGALSASSVRHQQSDAHLRSRDGHRLPRPIPLPRSHQLAARRPHRTPPPNKSKKKRKKGNNC
jgi:hypothetical protein